jgi:GAF domain-containing protein
VDDRDERIAQAFVAAADTLAERFDLAMFLAGLAQRCVELFETVEAGVLVEPVASEPHAPPVVASSTHAVQRLGLLELHHDHGPCTDSLRSGEAVGCCDLSAATDRWPTFAPEARAAGFSSVHALPMRVHDEVIGALNLFVRAPARLGPRELATVQAVADVASISILRRRAMEAAVVLADQLQHALHSRVVIEQAKGILSERSGLGADDAFGAMRRFARRRRLRIADVARGVVDRTFAADVIVPVAREATVWP